MKCRLVLLALTLLVVLLIFQLSRTNNPLLYYFLSTTPGTALTRTLGWHHASVIPLWEVKTEAEMTGEELQVRGSLEERLRSERPPHRVTLKDHKVMRGELLKQTKDYILFKEDYQDSGALSMKIRMSRIKSIETLDEPVPDISYRDVRFKMEFPLLNFYKRPPYSIMSDESFFQVEAVEKELQRMHKKFLPVFKDLVRNPQQDDSIQVLFFSEEDSFRAYQERCAPRMETSTGFYSTWNDRFVIFNHHHSEQVAAMSALLAERATWYLKEGNRYGDRGRVHSWQKKADRNLFAMAEVQTRETIRHEGSHQLFFTLGIHSTHRIENEWLFEGLATYCETDPIGNGSGLRAGAVKHAVQSGKHIPLDELVNHRSSIGLFSYDEDGQVDLAYSQSWTLVHFLMHRHRDVFFEFIRHIRERDHFWSVLKEDRFDLLCSMIGLSPEAFTVGWEQYVKTL